MLLSLHPNIIVHVENVVSLFSSPSTSSQKVRKCGSHNFLSQLYGTQATYTHTHTAALVYVCESVSETTDTYTSPQCEFVGVLVHSPLPCVCGLM